MKVLNSKYKRGLVILRSVLKKYNGVQAFNSLAIDSDRIYAKRILDININSYNIIIEYNEEYEYLDIICPKELYQAITIQDEHELDFILLNQLITFK